jgi:hypothetical protein
MTHVLEASAQGCKFPIFTAFSHPATCSTALRSLRYLGGVKIIYPLIHLQSFNAHILQAMYKARSFEVTPTGRLSPHAYLRRTFAFSKDPMSQRAMPLPSPSMGRALPRWSVDGQPVFVPLSIAGLRDNNA